MGTADRKVRVAVLFGGRNTEHAVSCASAASLLAAIDRDAYEPVPIGITQDGAWVLAGDDPEALRIQPGRELPRVDAKGSQVVLPVDPSNRRLAVVDPTEGMRALDAVDVVFPLFHGVNGEDGTVQGLLETAGLPYVGSGVLASAVCMDKEYAHILLRAAGLPVTDAVVLRAGQNLTDADRDLLGLPVFVKPARAGSSVGITKVNSWDELDAAVAIARTVDPKVLVEAAMVGRELECSVLEGLDGAPPDASVPGEVRVPGGREWFDFDAKYLDDSLVFDIPARVPGEITERVRRMAAAAFEALDCAGLARVDFFLSPDGTLTVNEVNTIPGFTSASMFPQAWAATGIEYPDLIDRLIRTALRRHR